jgi:ornithine cyclodeaminase/alanine dehydrogenase-like protein (mu-crystallin family)
VGGGPVWLSERDVAETLDAKALVAAVTAGLLTGAQEPGTLRMNGLDGAGSYLSLFPAHAAGGFASVKVLAGRPANARDGRPEIDAVVALVDPAEGRIVALLAARTLTAWRTAAVTAAALARLLPAGGARVALVGTGLQARAHLAVLAATGVARAVTIASPRGSRERAEAIAGEAAALGLHSRVVEPADAARQVDAVVLMTLASRPVPLGPLPDDLVIASIGPFYPGMCELDPGLVAGAAAVVSDDPDRLARQWAGEPRLDVPALRLLALADLLAGRAVPPGQGLRVFLSDGRAIEDNAAATLVWRTARASGRGTVLP